MTLAPDLIARYPWGTVLRLPVNLVRSLARGNEGRKTAEYTVVGWSPDNGLILLDSAKNTAQIAVDLIPTPPPPCPITEPVTLTHSAASQKWHQEGEHRSERVSAPDGHLTVYPFVEGDVDDDGPYMKARWSQ